MNPTDIGEVHILFPFCSRQGLPELEAVRYDVDDLMTAVAFSYLSCWIQYSQKL